MGAAFVPEQIITLEDIGLDEYPKTSSGKIKKTELAQTVRNYRETQEKQGNGTPGPSKNNHRVDQTLLDTVIWIWWKASGIDSNHLDINSPVSNFADSITIMRVRDMMRKRLGKTLKVEEMAMNPSIMAQVKILQGQDGQNTSLKKQASKRTPTLDALTMTFRTKRLANRMKQLIDETIKPFGFDWDKDVTAVIPCNDFMRVLVNTGIIDSWNFAIAIVTESSTIKVRPSLTLHVFRI